MNRYVLFFCLILSIESKRLYINDKLIRVEPLTNQHLEFLQGLEVNTTVDFWTDIRGLNQSIDIHLEENEYEKYILQFKKYSIPFEILINNLQEIIDNEEEEIVKDQLRRQMKRRWYEENIIDIVGTYASYDQMIGYLQEKASRFPNYVKLIDFGQTFESRSLKGISLQFNPRSTRNIWIDCGIHAREWITLATCIWIVEKLIEDYRNNDSIIRDLLDFWNVYIIPSLNPDGKKKQNKFFYFIFYIYSRL